MKTQLLAFWDRLRGSYWFIPSLMALSAAILAFVMIKLDETFKNETGMLFGYSRQPEGARALLSTVAGSIITVAGVTFSMTITALSLASSQFGPRLLVNFMRDRGSQIVLGTFIATFLYCLLVLRTVNGNEDYLFVPHISVACGVFLAIASLGVLIYFIHHISASLQAETVISRASHELNELINRIFPEPDTDSSLSGRVPRTEFEMNGAEVNVNKGKSGYLQAIDIEAIRALATEQNLIIQLEVHPGEFMLDGSCFLRVYPPEQLDDTLCEKLNNHIIIGSHRTLTQDVEFGFDQLVEIAVRALSPGINDPFTAVSCVDRLGEGLSRVARRGLPKSHYYDDTAEGLVRVILAKPTLPEHLVDVAFNQVRQAASSNALVTLRLLETLARLTAFAKRVELREAILRQAVMLERGCHKGLGEEYDRLVVRKEYATVLKALDAWQSW